MLSSDSNRNAGGGGSDRLSVRNVGKAEMEEILEHYNGAGREESRYCVIDVRTEEEVQFTGKLGDNVHTLSIQTIMSTNAFAMDDDDFQIAFGFNKPQLDETVVFSCAAGIRSMYACQAASAAGYSNLINYTGGANEWFRS